MSCLKSHGRRRNSRRRSRSNLFRLFCMPKCIFLAAAGVVSNFLSSLVLVFLLQQLPFLTFCLLELHFAKKLRAGCFTCDSAVPWQVESRFADPHAAYAVSIRTCSAVYVWPQLSNVSGVARCLEGVQKCFESV